MANPRNEPLDSPQAPPLGGDCCEPLGADALAASARALQADRPIGRLSRDNTARLFRVLVENASALHTLVDLEGRFVFVNQAARQVFGLPPEDCVGREAIEFVHPDDVPATAKAFERWRRRLPERGGRIENRQVSRSGQVTAHRWTVYPYRDEHGELLGFASTACNISDLRRTEDVLQSQATLQRALFDGMLDPLLTVDEHGVVQLASAAATVVFGYQPDELVGQNITLLMPEPHRSAHAGHLRSFREGRESNVIGKTNEFQVLHKNGELIDVELSVGLVPTSEFGRRLFIGCFRDVSERKRAQRAETSMLRALALLGESTAVLAHELKNPVTAVNLALRSVARQLKQDERSVLGELTGSMKRLERQLRQTLDFAKPIRLHLVRCDARGLFDSTARSLRPLLEAAGATIEVQIDDRTPGFIADHDLLEELLCNLVVNALETRDRGTRVLLSAYPQGRGELLLRVDDDGPGVPANLRDTLFRAFVTSKSDGTGLGLPICRRIAQEHGGDIELADRGRLGGAGFIIRLPTEGPP